MDPRARKVQDQIRAFAAELDWLTKERGFTSGRQLAGQIRVSHATVAAALRGQALPTSITVEQIVAACRDDVAAWEKRRHGIDMAARALSDDADTPAELIPGPLDQPVPAVDHADPDDAGCSADAQILHSRRMSRTTERQILGFLELRYSPSRRAAWARFKGFSQLDAIAAARRDVEVEVAVHRECDGARAEFRTAYAYDNHWSSLLVVGTGDRVWATGVVYFGGERAGSSKSATLSPLPDP